MPPIATNYLDKNKSHAINPEWKEYYIILEGIRQLGICNMWGAHSYLASCADISYELAKDVLCSWIKNYSELRTMYWPNDERIYINM